MTTRHKECGGAVGVCLCNKLFCIKCKKEVKKEDTYEGEPTKWLTLFKRNKNV